MKTLEVLMPNLQVLKIAHPAPLPVQSTLKLCGKKLKSLRWTATCTEKKYRAARKLRYLQNKDNKGGGTRFLVTVMQKMLRASGLDQTGRRTELIARIVEKVPDEDFNSFCRTHIRNFVPWPLH